MRKAKKGKSSPAPKPRVLGDHQQEGKKFIPPLLALPNLRLTSWLRDLVPEFVWLGLLVENLGLKGGSDLGLALAKQAAAVHQAKKKVLFGSVSSFSVLTDQERAQVISGLSESGVLGTLRVALEPLTRLYPDCPLVFIGSPTAAEVQLDGMLRLKRTLNVLFDKTSVTAMHAQATFVYIAFVTDILKVTRDSVLAQFARIAEYPDPSLPPGLDAAIRATIMSFGPAITEFNTGWPQRFWQRGFALEPCFLA